MPAASLFGETPARTAAIWQAVMEIDGVLRTPVGLIARGLFRGTADAQAPEMVDAAAEVAAELDRIETELADGRTWLYAPDITAVDVVLFPTLAWLAHALGHAEPASFSALRSERPWHEAWRARIEAQDWFYHTYPPHWR